MSGLRFKFMLVIAALLWAGAVPAMAAAPLKILALGTSLTQGYGVPPGQELPAVLQARLNASGYRVKVINAGVSGDTTAGGLSRLDWSLADRPDAAIVELGSNDALRGLPPKEIEKNLTAILTRLKAANIPVLLCGMQAPRNLGAEYDRQFDAIYPTLARRFDVILYPFMLEGVAMNPKLNQADGIHPNPAGVRIIADRMMPFVQKLLARVPGAHAKE
ncbi:MAG: arylesterase [Alphaproteobacteria bacterium]|nr:arylesterase [Alphaproteobacteria bacterium]MBN9567490.1 arylesterase [Alphaproteobacteria bacterium]MBN9578991.1 arylesterase [Alphaproteobacteria bacterium]MBN9591626.1 arylesterase [Alphaproteobacteria bacterium]OJY70844.1 MAG: arylesterase [Rhodospirillales bacterium 70-18]